MDNPPRHVLHLSYLCPLFTCMSGFHLYFSTWKNPIKMILCWEWKIFPQKMVLLLKVLVLIYHCVVSLSHWPLILVVSISIFLSLFIRRIVVFPRRAPCWNWSLTQPIIVTACLWVHRENSAVLGDNPVYSSFNSKTCVPLTHFLRGLWLVVCLELPLYCLLHPRFFSMNSIEVDPSRHLALDFIVTPSFPVTLMNGGVLIR